jgi:hypothetical protein
MNFANRENAEAVADRLYRLYSGQMLRGISATIGYPNPSMRGLPPLVVPAPDDQVTRARDPLPWKNLPVLLEMHRRYARANRENPSDALPLAIPVFHFENGIETAMLGGKVRWLGTRLHTYGEPIEPLIRGYAEFDWALPREENAWFQRYLEAYRYFVEHADGEFALSFQAGIIAMNFAVQLRGSVQAYLDMFDEPENLQRLLDYSTMFNAYLYGRVQEIVGPYNLRLYGNHPLSKYRADRQPTSSVDAYSLCAPGTLRPWGARQLAAFNSLVGGTALHIHENSRHMLEDVAEIPGWRIVAFTDGPRYPRSFDIRWELRSRMRDIPLQIHCGQEEFLNALDRHDLPGNVQYGFSTDSLAEAERIMARVRAYEAPDAARR